MLPRYEVVEVELKENTYQIVISAELFDSIGAIIVPYLKRKNVAIITDTNVAPLYLDRLKRSLESCSIKYCALLLKPGETSKSWNNLRKTVEWLLENQIERDDLILALGGGVIGDLVGFAASIVRRGVSLIQIPTTLLAQVDSSVGGKTGINSERGKNLIGTFSQPKLVVIDSSILKTLNNREFLAGYSEIVKYALIGDKGFFDWLNKNKGRIRAHEKDFINEAIKKSCMAKARIVALDEKEKGQRALLNLGHTFGHALETATGFSERLLHGEAVSIGCIMAFEISKEMGFCDDLEVKQVVKHFSQMGLKTDIKQIRGALPNTDEFLKLMLNDKKVKNGKLSLVLLNNIGSAFVLENVDLSKVRQFLFKKLN